MAATGTLPLQKGPLTECQGKVRFLNFWRQYLSNNTSSVSVQDLMCAFIILGQHAGMRPCTNMLYCTFFSLWKARWSRALLFQTKQFPRYAPRLPQRNKLIPIHTYTHSPCCSMTTNKQKRNSISTNPTLPLPTKSRTPMHSNLTHGQHL